MLTLETHPALDALEAELADVEAHVNKYSLADAIREGSGVTDQATTWLRGDGSMCAIGAGVLALKARGIA